MSTEHGRLTPEQVDEFSRSGFLIRRGAVAAGLVAAMRDVTRQHVDRAQPPLELEVDVHYPGAPASSDAPGGNTIRRLKQAHSRDMLFTDFVSSPGVVGPMQQLLGGRVVMPLAHHNCIMTKQPRHSSDTGWHQDVRYWSFERPDLVSLWLALGDEYPRNGCLLVIPGSHRMAFEPDRFDQQLFFRADHPQNQALIATARHVELAAGDVLLFHARTLHAASRNFTSETKYSVVFTFRSLDNPPRPGTRSCGPELLLPDAAEPARG